MKWLTQTVGLIFVAAAAKGFRIQWHLTRQRLSIFRRSPHFLNSARNLVLLASVLPLFSACSKRAGTALSDQPQEVLVMEVSQQDVPIVREWIGSLDGSTNADIRCRVTGHLISIDYKEGSVVQKGDLLCQIDPTTYEAALEQAKSSLVQAQANQLQTEQTEQRETELFEKKVESQQDRDNAVQSNAAAKAEVKAQEAAVRQAELNLQFTKVTAPITGVAGIANPGIGDLVGPSDANPLLTMSTVDPIKAYFQISEQDYLKLARKIESLRGTGEAAPPVEIILADGSLYPIQGKFATIDRQVDQQTGTIRIEALFANPKNILRPGQFVRVRVTVRNTQGALLVPQRAVNELQTSYEVGVIDGANRVQIRQVKVGEKVGSLWVIEDGLKAGDRIVVEGMQRIRDGQAVKPVAWSPSTPPPGR
jgi:membrane fusion protein, multidrug efflux system